MKKNNKGFMLVEVIITSTIIITTLISLYASFNRLLIKYQSRISYYDVDLNYALHSLIDYHLNNDINNYLNQVFQNEYVHYVIKDGVCLESDLKMCPMLINNYKINNLILTEYDNKTISKIKMNSTNLTETFKEYLDYINGYYEIKEIDNYNYIFIVEAEENGQYSYANVRLR